MFNGMMMDPEMMRLAQEQMSRMSPADLARIQQQMMSNPDLLKMASESMKNIRPEDMKFAAEQLKRTRPEEMAEISEKMANATPEEMAAMRTHLDAQVAYEINAAQMLKKQGNELHSQGRFRDALEKYLLAKENVKGIAVSNGRSLLLACSLNLMSCYLKTSQFDKCMREGTEVLEYDGNNVKALYRRGQAYKELGELENAVADLTKAHEVSPDDETIAEVLRDAEERLSREGGKQTSRGLVIEEISGEETSVSLGDHENSVAGTSVSQGEGTRDYLKTHQETPRGPSTGSESLQALKDDPESIRSSENFISCPNPETQVGFGNGEAEGIPPDMLKSASNVISKMSPDDLQRMLQLASPFQGDNPFPKAGSFYSNSSPLGSIPPEMQPDMLKTATDMMSKMSPEEMQRMFEMASSLKGRAMDPAADDLHSNGLESDNRSGNLGPQDSIKVNSNHVGESSSHGFSGSRSAPQSSLSTSTADLQEQMRNQMKDPAMRQMFSSMMKNVSPEMMASMSERFGAKLSREDAEKAHQSMSSLSPEDFDRMMKWADRIQRGAGTVKTTKNWVLGRPGIILAIVMLLLAVILRWSGFFSSY